MLDPLKGGLFCGFNQSDGPLRRLSCRQMLKGSGSIELYMRLFGAKLTSGQPPLFFQSRPGTTLLALHTRPPPPTTHPVLHSTCAAGAHAAASAVPGASTGGRPTEQSDVTYTWSLERSGEDETTRGDDGEGAEESLYVARGVGFDEMVGAHAHEATQNSHDNANKPKCPWMGLLETRLTPYGRCSPSATCQALKPWAQCNIMGAGAGDRTSQLGHASEVI